MAWEAMDVDLTDPGALILGGVTLTYLALIVLAYVRRGAVEPRGRGGWTDQVIALLGANLLAPLSLLPVRSEALETLAVGLSILGLGLSFWAVWHLRPAFSIVPEARRLIMTGPYRWVRHPLYLAGFAIGLGLLASRLSPAGLGLFIGFAYCQAWRMASEERLLAEHFPEYRQYQQRTWSLLPHVF